MVVNFRGTGYLQNFQHPVVVKLHLMHNKLKKNTWLIYSQTNQTNVKNVLAVCSVQLVTLLWFLLLIFIHQEAWLQPKNPFCSKKFVSLVWSLHLQSFLRSLVGTKGVTKKKKGNFWHAGANNWSQEHGELYLCQETLEFRTSDIPPWTVLADFVCVTTTTTTTTPVSRPLPGQPG